MSSKIPNDSYAMIIGAMKCATSSLFHYLIQHPEISHSKVKEPEYFSEHQTHGIEVETYEEIFEFDLGRHKVMLEASTGYTTYPHEDNVPKNIYEYGIRPKFIYSIRNPFDRIASQYRFSKERFNEKGKSMVSADTINISNYYLQLEQYRKYFSVDNILILDFDEIRESPKQVLQKIYLFLDLDLGYYPEKFEVMNKTRIQNEYVNAIAKRFKGTKKFIPQKIKSITKKSLEQLFPSPKKDLSVNERDLIYQSLEKDMQKLHKEYNVDVSKWGF